MHLRGLLLSGTRIVRAPDGLEGGAGGDTSGAGATSQGDAAAAAEAAASSSAASASSSTAAPVRPENLPDEFWDDAAGVKTTDLLVKYQEGQTKLSEIEAARGEVPTAADGYELKLPEDFKLPDGFKVQIDANDPTIAAAREAALAAGMTNKEFGRALQVEAIRQVQAQKVAVETFVAEKGKLGANADARIGAVSTWIKANLPTAEAEAVNRTLTTAATIQAYERIMALRTPQPGPGAAQPTPELEGKFGASRLAAINSRAA